LISVGLVVAGIVQAPERQSDSPEAPRLSSFTRIQAHSGPQRAPAQATSPRTYRVAPAAHSRARTAAESNGQQLDRGKVEKAASSDPPLSQARAAAGFNVHRRDRAKTAAGFKNRPLVPAKVVEARNDRD
jgi:hypothetical protein